VFDAAQLMLSRPRPSLRIVSTPTRARAAPAELHPAGRRTTLKPPYPRHRPLLQSLERWFQRCNRGYVVAAEPFSDTPVVMPSKPHEYSICASLSPYQPLAGGGFSVPALFSRDRRRRNYLQLRPLLVCFQGRLHDPGSPVSPALAGSSCSGLDDTGRTAELIL
jgi:hypothetical protein